MTVTVAWAGLDRVRKEDGWVFEVVPADGVDREAFGVAVVDASEATEVIVNEDPERFGGFVLPYHFMTGDGVGYWNEYRTEKPHVRLGMGLFIEELDRRGVDATIRAIRQSQPTVIFDHMEGIAAAGLINGTRLDGPNNWHRWEPDSGEVAAIFELVLPWCAGFGTRWWLKHSLMSLKVEPETFGPLARQFVLNGHEPTTLVAADKAGNYRTVRFGYQGNLVIGSSGPDFEGSSFARTVIGLLASISPHLSHAFVAHNFTNQGDLEALQNLVWSESGHQHAPDFARKRRRPTAAFAVVGAQLLGPEFPTVEPADGWTLTALPGHRRLLAADDQHAWFDQPAPADLIADACALYPTLTDTDPQAWRLT